MVWDTVTKYRLLLEINNAIVKETSRAGLFQALANEISKIFHYDRFSINLYDPETESLSYFATADGIAPAGISKGERPLTKGAIANAVVRSREPLILSDLSSHIYWASVRAMRSAGLNATMAYPLIVRDQVLGSIHFSFTRTPSNMDDLVDFITDLSGQVAIAVDNMLSHTKLQVLNEQLKLQKNYLLSQDQDGSGLGGLFYASQVMKEVMRQADILAKTDVSVLLTGETGTGKDLIARHIHNSSARCDALLVKVNCPALTGTLFESELFGHAKGAFTGALANRVGRFEMADGGTLFLDEIGDLDVGLQAKLLHVLQDGVFERVGDSRPISVDFRLISATNKELDACLLDKSFRSDLYYRLNTVSIHVPPLRERIDDIPILVDQLTTIQAQKTHRAEPQYSASALETMGRYTWPGNVRELKNLVKRLVIMRSGETVTERDIEAIISEVPFEPEQGQMTLAEVERLHIRRTLTRTGGVVGGPHGAAALLGLPRSTLQYRMKKHGIIAESK